MTVVVLALSADLASIAAASFANSGVEIRTADPFAMTALDLAGADIVVIASDPRILNAAFVAECDRAGVRIAPYAPEQQQHRLAAAFGLAPLTSLEADRILNHPVPTSRVAVRGGIIAVWGTHGAPGRSTVAASLAVALAADGSRVALVDADASAPSLAIMLSLSDDAPGFASACRSAERRTLDAEELTRISQPLTVQGGSVQVLTGINRPNRWPELSAHRVHACLEVARGWAEFIVVDVAASLEEDEEIVSDMEGPRRNAATLTALRSADHVVAVAGADAVGISRFIRAQNELRATVGETAVHTVVNRARSSVLGVDAKGQIRRTLSRFAGIDNLLFLANEPVIADGALLHGRAIADIAPKSAFAAGIRRLSAEISGAQQAATETVAEPRRRRKTKAVAVA